MTSGRRKSTIVLSAAVTALALGTAALSAAVPAQADTPQPTAKRSVQPRTTASQAELLRTVKDSADRLQRGESGAPADADSGDGSRPAPGPSGRTVDPKIIGGAAATLDEAPWMVQLHYYDDKGTADTADDEGYFCGGTLVAPAKVLTAAHCVDGLDWETNGAVVGGTTQLPEGGDLHGGTATGVWKQWVHPDFDDVNLDFDVAVLTLGSALPYQTLQPAASGDTARYKTGTPATVYGWGRTSSTSDDISPVLLKASVPVQADSACSGYFGSEFVPEKMVCAGQPASGQDTGTVSPCNGDSGGPLVVNGRIAGVVSWGVTDCVESGAYSVYAKTATFAGEVNPRVDDANLNFDDKADLFARASNGEGFNYYSRGTSLGDRESVGDWQGIDLVRQADVNRDFYQDYVYRNTAGELYWWGYDSAAETYLDHKIGPGWGSLRNITLTGDVTGDGFVDLTANDSAGTLWMWAGRGNGTFAAKVQIGVGWSTYQVYGRGDYSGDGKPDLIARDASAVLWMYKGTGSASAPFSGRVKVGTGWNFTAYATTGDVTGDGRADFIVRDTAGVLWAYKSTGSATVPFATSARIKLGVGWGSYSLLG
ncbi:trypsin-like serine protease [[Kitasatospora] papulosa]|uniref:trypsin-like serine protease n=1 Tax=Streptomyces TaxID=1883 RepID=UPI0004C8D6DD|nr:MULTISPECIES: trypsin-like serine protease [Streptomyces]MCX4412128.1 trypsin-like serine protease [[Kitasatospora] papulosa]MEE1778302.1 trypsin-like serine protease [Streptomyces sp. JV181]MYT57861.1 trypsin-like serine protease [Streptomyces sp. SID7834]